MPSKYYKLIYLSIPGKDLNKSFHLIGNRIEIGKEIEKRYKHLFIDFPGKIVNIYGGLYSFFILIDLAFIGVVSFPGLYLFLYQLNPGYCISI